MSDPLPAGGPERERLALVEIEHTAVSPFTVRLLLTFFLTAIAAVPIVELATARARAPEGIGQAWSHLARVPDEISTEPSRGRWNRIVAVNRILLTGLSGFERALENTSTIGQVLRPPAQTLMTGWLGAGNERVYPGLDRWLFYRPDIEYITGRGFLEPAALRKRMAAAPAWVTPPQPDPRDAIVRFNTELEARGVALVVVPVPGKPAVHPEMIAARYAELDGVLMNASYGRFVEDLRRNRVDVFDPSEALAAASGADAQYLVTDTHWRPESMESVAERLAAFISTTVVLPVVPDPGYRIAHAEIRNHGDIARMLDLPEGQQLFPPETVGLRRVVQGDGSAWRSSPDADVLVLGDSFSNIYTLESMGWGTAAGLVEQLSYALRRPLDRLVQNDEGAFATRALLQRNPQRLAGKRLVVYQFATRELAFGDWKVLPLQ